MAEEGTVMSTRILIHILSMGVMKAHKRSSCSYMHKANNGNMG